MPLVELKIPAGFHYNGTEAQAEGRWYDGNLVRWLGGSLRPVGGWDERGTAIYNAPPRGMFTWEDQSNTRWMGVGTYNKLYVTNAGNVTSDITPVGLTAGRIDATYNSGFGGGTFGTGFYGQPRPDTGVYDAATTWSLDGWGQYLVACSPDDGKLYEWQLNTATPAAAITNAPTGCLGLVVAEERFIFALGASGDPRKVAWCDFEDNTVWTPASTNQAGSKILQTGGRIMAGIRTQGQTVILTDQDAHRANYVGPPFIFNFERVGDACGLVARRAVANTPAGVFWMGRSGFFRYDGANVQEIPCEVSDKVFRNINVGQISKCWAMSNGQYSEVWFFYPSAGSTEIDSYVAYDYQENHWLVGSINRTCGADRGVFRYPLMANSGGDLFNHETGYNYDGATVFVESGPYKIGAGDNLAVVTRLIPDEATLGDVNVTFKTRLYPTGAETTHGPYTMANPTSVRFTGRSIKMRHEAQTASAWRTGNMRVEVMQGSKR